jgi:hypothetical protein
MYDTRHPEERPVGSVSLDGPRYDENTIQEAAEFVAARHIDTRSPEWIEFVWDRIDRATTGALLRGDLTVLQPLREEFTEWIVDSYRDGGTFYNEMRRELGL